MIPERRQWRRSGVFIVNFEHVNVDRVGPLNLHVILIIFKICVCG